MAYKTAVWKKCINCSHEAFSNDKSFAKGGNRMCNRCNKAEWEKNNPDRLRAQRLRGNAGKRAKDMGWPPPDFDTDWLHQKIKNGHCEVTGIKFNLEEKTTLSCHAKNPWVPSIDRIDSSKPYLKDNVQLVVFMYNVCKGEFNHEDVVKFCCHVHDREIKNEKI